MQMTHWQPEIWRMRGVPPAPNPPSTYIVFVGNSHWQDLDTSNYPRCLTLPATSTATSLVQPLLPTLDCSRRLLTGRPAAAGTSPSPTERPEVTAAPPVLQRTMLPPVSHEIQAPNAGLLC